MFVTSTLSDQNGSIFFFEQYANIVFPLVTTTFSIFSVAIIATTLLFLGVFIPHSGEFTRFLHRLGFLYLIYYIWLESSGIVLRFDPVRAQGTRPFTEALLEIRQEDSLFFRLFTIYANITVAVFFFGIAERFFLSKRGRLEFPILVFFLHFGGLFAIRLHTFRDLFLALERVTLASYVFVTFERQNRFSTYAGVQYFILGSLPSARLLLAFGFFYLQGGSVAFQDLDLIFNTVYTTAGLTSLNISQSASAVYYYLAENSGSVEVESFSANNWSFFSFDFFDNVKIDSILNAVNPINSLSLRALFFLFFNLLFKLTAAPFHVWAPSVYGKAPIASVTFLSIYSKARVLFLLFKLLTSFLHVFSFFTLAFFLVSGVLSIFVGRVGAFSEKRVKRFFVYSSRGHVGFRLIGLGLATLEGSSARFHYLAVYIVSSFVRWFLLLTRGRSKSHLSHFAELKNANPFLALLFAFLVFSRSGIPPLGGFFIKLDILAALLDTSHFFTNYILFFFTVASFFYYLRLIKIIFFDAQDTLRITNAISFSSVYATEYPQHTGRLWLRVSFVSILGVYIFIIQKPLLALQYEVLACLY